MYVVLSISVAAFVPDVNSLFAMVSSSPGSGYLFDPSKVRCSRVCGTPEELKISVRTIV